MKLTTKRVPRLVLGTLLAAAISGTSFLPASADDSAPIALPIPTIPGVAALPGPMAPAATPIQTMGVLKVAPDTGVSGAPVTISGAGLPANTDVTVTWATSNVTWVLDAQPSTVNYRGRQATPVTVVIQKVTTDGNGAFSFNLNAPNDFGGIHDIYAVVNGKQVAHGGFLIKRSLTVTPKSGPVGTPITITYRGLGASLYEGGASLLYDNHFTGAVMANWTRGTATFKIRAAGSVGKHVITVGDAITFLYMNIQQAPIPWAEGFTQAFKVTKDIGRPKTTLDWPADIAPTMSERTTLQLAGNVTDSSVRMHLATNAKPVGSSVDVSASGLTSGSPVSFQWATVVGNRVNCTGQCWSTVNVPLGQATPANGSVSAQVKVPDGLGGWHVIQMLQGDKIVAQQPFFVKESIVGNGVSSLVLKPGQAFTIHMKGIGWTQVDNTRAVDYDNSYIGYGCGFNSNGDVVFNLHATGGTGTHLIDIYPLLYTQQPSYANTPYGMIPILTYRDDVPGLALGYQLPAARLAITIKK